MQYSRSMLKSQVVECVVLADIPIYREGPAVSGEALCESPQPMCWA